MIETCEIYDIKYALEELGSLLQAYIEHRDRELEGLKTEKAPITQHFKSRNCIGSALLSAITEKLYAVIDDCDTKITAPGVDSTEDGKSGKI